MAVNTVLLVRRRSFPLSAFVFARASKKTRKREGDVRKTDGDSAEERGRERGRVRESKREGDSL